MLSERGIHASAYALVHAAVAGPERERHATFLAHMLLLAFAALAVAPPFLAFRGVPTPTESLLFTLSLAPAAAAMLVARTGRLALGHLVASTGFAGVAFVLFLGVQAGPGVAVVWIAAAYLEVAASRNHRAARVGALGAGAALAGIVTLSFEPRFAPAVSPASAALLASLAMLAAALAAHRLAVAPARANDDVPRASGTVEAILDAVVLGLDARGTILSVSRPEGSFLAVPDHAMLGRGLLDQVLVADRPAVLKLIDDAAHGARAVRGRFRLLVSDRGMDGHAPNAPRYLTVEMRARREVGASAPGTAGACEIIGVLTDVTGREQHERELAAARSTVDGAHDAKLQFLTTMSHELRTPLNAIIGFSEMLASRTTRPGDVGKQCEFARVINQSGQHLLGVVNALLDVSRLQSGAFSIQPEPFDAVALLDHSIEAVAAEARAVPLRIVRDYPAALEEMVGDRRALKRALVALLSNAIKVTPAHGQLALAARPEGNALVVSVADTGIGIAAEDLERLGDVFFQAAGSTSRPFDGAGLGLALVRGLVGLHGGTLTIASGVGTGTRATIKLPLDCRHAAPDPLAPIATLALPPTWRPSIKDAA